VDVAIDKAGNDDPAGGNDGVGTARRRQVFHPPAGAYFGADPAANQERTVGNRLDLLQLYAATRTLGTAQCD
jgi:hypothetical protein